MAQPMTRQGNHTGLSASEHAERMLEVTRMMEPGANGEALKKMRGTYRKEPHGLGSMPETKSGKSSAASAALVDKLAERLAFERTGVRLYDALLDKLDASSSFEGGPTWDAVKTIRDEELAHAHMLKQALTEMGADPTAVTPSADLVAVEGQGLAAVLGDPRTSVGQCLHALIVAELADGEGWTLLRTLAEESKLDDLLDRIADAERDEERHLEQVRGWLKAAS